MDKPGYDDDLVLWAEQQAGALRSAAGVASNLGVDWANVAEEIEDLGKSQRRDLASRVSTILVHLLKLEASPSIAPRPAWRESIREQRDAVARVLEDAPSLRQAVPALITKELPNARRRALAALADYAERPRVDVEGLAYAEAEVIEEWWPPEVA